MREATLERYRGDNDFVKKLPGDDELPPVCRRLYTHPPFTAAAAMGHEVDMNVCTGCSACVIACQAENNIPVVGKLQVGHGRVDALDAHRPLLREPRKASTRIAAIWPENPEMVHQPMMCQHCENAPCETVCPVNATVHSEDGLNVMAYNRCVGTRYCANNCPFKVRRFNFFDYNQRPVGKRTHRGAFSIYEEYLAPLTTKGAPDIDQDAEKSERHRAHARRDGEMHLLRAAHRGGENRGARARRSVRGDTRIPRDSFTTACAQACPTEAIVFGDIKDPESRVSKMKEQDRNYRLLDYLEHQSANELSGAHSQSESEDA